MGTPYRRKKTEQLCVLRHNWTADGHLTSDLFALDTCVLSCTFVFGSCDMKAYFILSLSPLLQVKFVFIFITPKLLKTALRTKRLSLVQTLVRMVSVYGDTFGKTHKTTSLLIC